MMFNAHRRISYVPYLKKRRKTEVEEENAVVCGYKFAYRD